MPIARNISALTLITVAVALPGSADASVSVSASAVVTATARAERHLEQARQLADQGRASAKLRARTLLTRSRHELRSAAAAARALSVRADTADKVSAAVDVNTMLSSALSDDTDGLAEIAINGRGRLERTAAAGLASDMRLQQQILEAVLKLAGDAGADAEEALEGALSVQHDTSAETIVAADVAAQTQPATRARASADLAVALGIQAIAAAAQTARTAEAIVADSAASALQLLSTRLGRAAVRIYTHITGTQITDDQVMVSGSGSVSLGLLGRLGINATADVQASTAANALSRVALRSVR